MSDTRAHPRALAEAPPAESAGLTDVERELLTQRQAAQVLQVSVAYLRASSCPKLLLPGSGPCGKPLVRYLRSDVLSWAMARRT
ncbi:MAG TPA: hypothetical protein VK132_10215 [Gemmatimonadales bacterium]|nr:hypothetical protein [Gemmatimonadales bacterium]